MTPPARIHWQDQPTPEPPTSRPGQPPPQPPPAPAHPPTLYLDQVSRDLSLLANEGSLMPIFGRQSEMFQLQRILLRKKKNTPLLVGAPGVGKTALVEGLAVWIANKKSTPALANLRIVELSPTSLVAGTIYRGSFEERLQVILTEARQDPNLVLFIDEIHVLIRAGAIEGGALDAANILKPALARGDLRCIGATTPDEFDRFIKSDPAFERRFEPLILDEPSETEAVAILSALRSDYESHHGVRILPEAIEAAVRLSSAHILDRYLPDKALDLLDNACVFVRLPSPESRLPTPGLVDAAAVMHALAQKAGISLQRLGEDQRARLATLEAHLELRIVGQALAINRISAALQSAFSGLGHPNQPRHVFAFFGSSGVGKTATAKALAEFLFDTPDALLRLDMSEYKEAHTVSRLLGSPPGYVGYTDEGTFATRLRRQPACVVLLDEIEKAHPDILDVFLQIFDEGRFSDARGRKIEARQAVFILTSNLFTSAELATPEIYDQQAETIRQNLAAFLRPEFVNRINTLILFRSLAVPDLVEIAAREITALNQRLTRFQVCLRPTQDALRLIAAQSIDPNSGARAVLRSVARWVAEPTSAALIQGLIKPGQAIDLVVESNQVCLKLLG